jgi:ketosteroid isomerase-like protein
MSDLDELRNRYHRSLEAFIQGDAQPQVVLWSRRDDVTLANPLGPPAKGWDRVRHVAERAASLLREGEGLTFDLVSSYETADLAYDLEIERCRVKLGGADELVPVALRVTTIFRREVEGWQVVHRHADAITQARPPESIVQAPADHRDAGRGAPA